jgi:hypothetical protein
MRPAWPRGYGFRRLVLDVERRFRRALLRQAKAVVTVEGIGLQIAPVIDQERLGAVIKLDVLGNVWQAPGPAGADQGGCSARPGRAPAAAAQERSERQRGASQPRRLVTTIGLSSSYWPRAARTKKLANTAWLMSMESNSRRRRESASRIRAARRMAGS